MIGVPVNPNSVCVPMVQNDFRQSINNINHRISSNKILIILAIAYGLIIAPGIVFFIVGGITNINSDKHGFPILVGIAIALTMIGLIVFGSGCCLIQTRCVARLRQAITTESIQYSSRSSIALKYLGLLAMSKILHTHSKSVQVHSDLIVLCLDNKDESIHLRALDLLSRMVTRKALIDIVHKLMIHMDKSEGSYYRDELLSKIIEICSQNDY
ncbi:unnamed protein product [Rotaria sordida]|uniref:Clathrin/coatomer adaptor adaptin-like N-terminal domain-containing protein n=1 Tax=Rotaria sordida TaxID=392033 RepID=A0A820C308_9BILA|nr:unnamed protein product [Rotaria sordida]